MTKIPQIASLVGILLLIGAFIWWQQTFGIDMDYLKCLAVSDGICKLSGVGKLLGGAGYNPIIFWAGLACIVVGFVLNKFKIL